MRHDANVVITLMNELAESHATNVRRALRWPRGLVIIGKKGAHLTLDTGASWNGSVQALVCSSMLPESVPTAA
jgi:hypothetical protein